MIHCETQITFSAGEMRLRLHICRFANTTAEILLLAAGILFSGVVVWQNLPVLSGVFCGSSCVCRIYFNIKTIASSIMGLCIHEISFCRFIAAEKFYLHKGSFGRADRASCFRVCLAMRKFVALKGRRKVDDGTRASQLPSEVKWSAKEIPIIV